MNTMDASLSEQTASRIREAILAGRIKPGERLNVDGLARAFAASKTPVREALNVLSAERLVVYRPKIGYAVKYLTIDEYIQASEVQKALELYILLKLAKSGTPLDFDRLEAINGELCDAIRSEDEMKIFHLNEVFHMEMYERCDNQMLVVELRRVWNELLIHRYHMFSSKAFMDLIVPDHDRIIEAMRLRDPAKIEAACHAHFQSGEIGVSQGVADRGSKGAQLP